MVCLIVSILVGMVRTLSVLRRLYGVAFSSSIKGCFAVAGFESCKQYCCTLHTSREGCVFFGSASAKQGLLYRYRPVPRVMYRVLLFATLNENPRARWPSTYFPLETCLRSPLVVLSRTWMGHVFRATQGGVWDRPRGGNIAVAVQAGLGGNRCWNWPQHRQGRIRFSIKACGSF